MSIVNTWHVIARALVVQPVDGDPSNSVAGLSEELLKFDIPRSNSKDDYKAGDVVSVQFFKGDWKFMGMVRVEARPFRFSSEYSELEAEGIVLSNIGEYADIAKPIIQTLALESVSKLLLRK
ncbi:hypothetical protein EQG49_13265 [Periweissella cryptocerci]|uniref:Uncharacterized protein n=1 Tax=Periweissella cryptocerci TaxID=2506420 RepID=A0A4P6YX34_9LACO|nr:hypothetical protein [Periweissella cryptocerci]QBO37366.1 hypothetical protein EQG49_13265 [Periweissella cryptocerci]